MKRIAGLVACMGALCVPGIAAGATVSEQVLDGGCCNRVSGLIYQAGAGEQNNLTFAEASDHFVVTGLIPTATTDPVGDTAVLLDPGATIRLAGAPDCKSLSRGAICSALLSRHFSALTIGLGDGNDSLILGDNPDNAQIDLGAGNDMVEAVDLERDYITCGDGLDRVIADSLDVIAADCESARIIG